MLNHYDIELNDKDANPKTLNAWLKKNDGYTSQNAFRPESIEKLGTIQYFGHISDAILIYGACMSRHTCIINVNQKLTWALVTYVTKNNRGDITFFVMDPAQPKKSYPAGEVSSAECYYVR